MRPELRVGGCLGGQGEGIGAGGGRHTPPAQLPAEGVHVSEAAGRRHGDRSFANAQEGGELLAGLAARGYKGVAVREAGEESAHVSGLQDLQESVAGVVLEAADLGGGVLKGEAGAAAKFNYGIVVETPAGRSHKVLGIAKMHQAHYPPEIIVEIWVEEVHRPPRAGWRETAKEQDPGSCRQEWLQWMILYSQSQRIIFSSVRV